MEERLSVRMGETNDTGRIMCLREYLEVTSRNTFDVVVECDASFFRLDLWDCAT